MKRVSKKPRRRRLKQGRNWERDSYGDQPWNKPCGMRLYVAPWIKERLKLECETTVEYLEKHTHESENASHETGHDGR